LRTAFFMFFLFFRVYSNVFPSNNRGLKLALPYFPTTLYWPTAYQILRFDHSSSPIVRRKDSAISCTPSRNPYENASRSVMPCISSMHSSNFSRVSFCLSVSVPSYSSRFLATNFSRSFNRLSPRVHCSKGETLPYQSSSIVPLIISLLNSKGRFITDLIRF